MRKCIDCGKPSKQFKRCYACMQKKQARDSYEAYRRQTPEERELEREIYYSTECDMCGKEGASPHSDGRNYCSMCWTVWNS